MKERYYNDITLEKDLKFCEYMQELEENPEVIILQTGEKVLVHEMKTDPRYGYSRPRIDTGRTHVGFDTQWVYFYYRGIVWYVQPSAYYPFTDDNYPGMFNFIPHLRVDRMRCGQSDYFHPYYGLSSIDDYCPSRGRGHRTLAGVDFKIPNWNLPYDTESKISGILAKHGGYREREIWDDPVVVRAETWNDEHKVVDVYAARLDEDGHRDRFSVDLVTGTICG